MKSKKILCCILASMIVVSTTAGATLSVSAADSDVIAVSDGVAEQNQITAEHTNFIVGEGNNKKVVINTNSTSQNVSVRYKGSVIASTEDAKKVTIQNGVVTVSSEVFHDIQDMMNNLTLVFDDGTLDITVFDVSHSEDTSYTLVMTMSSGYSSSDIYIDEETNLYTQNFTNNYPDDYTLYLFEWDKDNNFAVVKKSTNWSYQSSNEGWVADAMVTYDESTDEMTVTVTREYDPNEPEEIELSYFENWGYYIKDETDVVIKTYEGEEAEVTVPDTIEDMPVVELGNDIFKDHKEIVSVTLPKTITQIGESAFENCQALVNIELPSSLETLESNAFKGCSSLTEITLPEELYSWGASVFENCTSLTNITIPSKISNIEDSLFKNCKNLKEVNIPEGIYTIDSNAFANCTSLTNIVIPKSVEFLGNAAFKNCTSLSGEITLADVEYISYYAFYGCRNLQKVVFTSSKYIVDDTALNIEAMAFGNCTSLKEVDFLMKDYVTVKKTAFFNCIRVKTIRYTGSNEQWKSNVKVELLGNIFFSNAMVYFDNMNYIKLEKEEMNIYSGETVALNYSSAPYSNMEAKLKSIVWKSSNPEVATVDQQGNVTAKNTGTTDIIVTSTDVVGNTRSSVCKLTVTVPTESITLNKTAVNIGVSQKYELVATVTPDAALQNLNWSSSDKYIATVDQNGVVTGKRTGTVTITAKSWDGKKVTCKVNVKRAPESIQLDRETLTMNALSTYQFTKTLSDKNSATSYKWESSNPDVVKVYSTGKIVSLQSGTAVITVTTHNGKTASCTVTVK